MASACRVCSAKDLRVAQVLLPSVTAFKAVGDQRSVLEYSSAHPPRVTGDWSAIYLQLNEPHALGTVSYRWDMGYSVSRLLRLELRDVAALVVDAPWMPDGSIGGDAKASAVKEALGVADGQPLTEALGLRGQALVCRETEDQWELVVPPGLLQSLAPRDELVLELRPNPRPGRPDQCRAEGEDEWRRLDDTEALREVPAPGWILEALAGAGAPEVRPAASPAPVSEPAAGAASKADGAGGADGAGAGDGTDGAGCHPFVAEWDEEGVYFYQAFNAEIANWAIEHQKFGGPKFNPGRMTWIKPSFAWMLYRCGYGFKDQNQERVLKVKLPHEAVAHVLERCVEGHGQGSHEGRIQWDPARSLTHAAPGSVREPARMGSRAIQIGMKGDLSRYYVSQALSITDVTDEAHRVRDAHALPVEECTAAVGSMLSAGRLPAERQYAPHCAGEVLVRVRVSPG